MTYKSVRSWSLQQKLLGGCFVFLSVLVLFGAWFIIELWHLEHEADSDADFDKEITFVESVSADDGSLIATLRMQIDGDSTLLRDRYAQVRAQMDSLLDSILANDPSPALDALVSQASSSRQRIDVLDGQIEQDDAAGDKADALSLIGSETYLDAQADFTTTMASYLQVSENLRESRAQAQRDQIGFLLEAFCAFLILFVLAGLWATSALSRSVVGSIRSLGEAAGAIGKGDFSHRVPVVSQDEIGDLATAINKITMVLVEDDERGGKLRKRLLDITRKIGQA